MSPPLPSAAYGGGVVGGDQSLHAIYGNRHCSTETLTASSFLPSSLVASGLARPAYDHRYATARSIPRTAYLPSVRLEPHPQYAFGQGQAYSQPQRSTQSRGRGVGLGLSRRATITPHSATTGMDAFLPHDVASPNLSAHGGASGVPLSSGLTFEDLVHSKTPPQTIGAGYSPGMRHAELGSIFADFDLNELMRQSRRADDLSSPNLASDGSSSNVASPVGPADRHSTDVPDLVPSGHLGNQMFNVQPEMPSLFRPMPGSTSPMHAEGGLDSMLNRNDYASGHHNAVVQNELDKVFGLGRDGTGLGSRRDSSSSWRSASEASSGVEDDSHSPFGAVSSPSSVHQAGSPYLVGPAPFSPEAGQLMYRTNSNVSDLSISSSEGSFFDSGINPTDVNPSSYPDAPAEPRHGFASAYNQHWWNGMGSRSMDALADGLDSRMAFGQGSPAPDEDNDSTVRAKDRTREGFGAVFAPGARTIGAGSGLSSSLPTDTTISKARSKGTNLRSTSRIASDYQMTASAQRPVKTGRHLFGITDYTSLPTKRSRGRRPVMSHDVGLADAHGRLADCVQSVPGGSAFDPTLNPEAAAVEFCETTKTGKPKKIFVCKVAGCGKVFK